VDNLPDVVDNPLTLYRVINRIPTRRRSPGLRGCKEEGTDMGWSSGRVILVCEQCGERLVLGEPEDVWLSTRTLFECECGKDVSLVSRLEESIPVEHYERLK
jgi:hypothetical protein